MDVRTVRWWVARFSSGDSDVKDKPRSRRTCTAFTPRNEERGLRGQHFPSNDAVVRAVKQWAISAGADFYERGMQALVNRWRMCIANGGNNVEN